MKIYLVSVDLQQWYFKAKHHVYRKIYGHLSECALRYGLKTIATGMFPVHDKRIERFIEEADPLNVIDGYYPISWADQSIDVCHFTDARNIIIYKHSFDPFEGCPLMESAVIMAMADVAIVYGYNMFGAVDKTVEGLIKRNVKTVVLHDATISKSNKASIAAWHAAGAVVTSVQVTDLSFSILCPEEDGFAIEPIDQPELYA